MSGAERARLTREDWCDAALRVLAREGLGAVAVERIARDLGVTKGSFYWHFKGRGDLVDAALARWEEVGTAAVVAAASGDSPRARLERLFETAFDPRDRGAIVVHLTAHASLPEVAGVLERVTARRLEFLSGVYRGTGLADGEARRRALLAYSAYLGMSVVLAGSPDVLGDDRPGYVSHLIRTLVPV